MMPTRRQMVCDEELRLSNGKENSAGKNCLRTSEILCPESTSTAVAIVEQPELRAYKLGKQKCSYNQVELVIKDISGGKLSELRVSEAIETIVGTEVEEQLRESCLKFHVRFVNNARIQLYIYVVYSSPYGTTRHDKHTVLYHWMPVTRSKCRKGCTGSVIRGLQRFGRMPRRGAAAVDGEDTWKEPRHLYIAIDEASTHVCPRHETSKFRLLVAAYDDRHQLLGTTVSSSIRVLANNDAPLGAASFKLHCHLKGVLKGPSPIRSSRLQLSDYQNPVQCRLPLLALPPNTSPSRSKTTATEEMTKSDSSTSKATVSFMPNATSESSNKQVAAVTGEEQRKNPAIDGPQGDIIENAVPHVTSRVLEVCSLKPVESIVSLRTLAKIVGSKREVVAEILSVLQSVGVVHQQEKEKYRWLGSSTIMSTLTKLSKEINPNGRRKLKVQSAGSRNGPSASLIQQRASRHDETVDNSIFGLSKRLIRLFLIDVTAPVSWDQAFTIFQDNHHDDNDAEELRLKGRRLLEILRIFGTLHLVKRCVPKRYSASSTYHWVGAEAVINYLSELSGRVPCPYNTGLNQQGGGGGAKIDAIQSVHRGNGIAIPSVIVKDRSIDCLPKLLFSTEGLRKCLTRDSLIFAAGSSMQSNVRSSAPHYLRSSKNITARRRDFSYESTNGSYESDDAFANNSIELSQHLGVPTNFRQRLENVNEKFRRSKRKSSDSNEDSNECDPFSASKLIGCQLKCFKTRTSIPKRPRLVASSSLVTDLSSVEQDGRNCAGLMNNHAYEPPFLERRGQEQVCCDVTDPITQPLLEERQDGSTQQQESDAAFGNDGYPFGSGFSIAGCVGTEVAAEKAKNIRTLSTTVVFNSQCRGDHDVVLKTGEETSERSNGRVLEASEAPTKQFCVDNVWSEYGPAGPSVFQFPYKKRPHNWSSFLAVAAPRCFDNQPLPIEYSHPGYFLDLTDRNYELPCFKPLYYLQQLLTPQQVEQVTAQNPAFLFHYVHYFRVIYHKLSAQAARKDQAVVRPVAEHGAVEMPSYLFAKRGEESSAARILPTLQQLLIPFSQAGLWLKKCPDSDRTSCHSPISTHHVDKATAEDLSDR